MLNKATRFALALSTLSVLASGCSTTARYVTTEHWSSRDTFYVGFTEYKETNLVVTRYGSSSAHLMLCNAADSNNVTCKPQLAVDRLLNPGEKYPDEPPPPAAPAPAETPTEQPPAASEGEAVPSA